jgi:hypothetical protein
MQLDRKVVVEVDTCDHERIERKRKERVFKKGKVLCAKESRWGIEEDVAIQLTTIIAGPTT